MGARRAVYVRTACERAFVAKPADRREAQRLRVEAGASVCEIARALGVSQSTASRWVRDVPITPEQRAALDARNPALTAAARGTAASSAARRAVRRAHQEEGRHRARAGDALHQHGCMLYWAEGSKSRNTVVFTNSDGAMMRLFVRFLRESYSVQDEHVRLTVNCFLGNGLSLDAIEGHWLSLLDLPRTSLRKATVNRPSRASRSVRGHVLRYGTARVAVHSTALVQSIYGAIQEYGGFEEPAWLG